MANDLFDSLRTYINKVSANEKSAAEIANSVNAWVRESGEAVKHKIEEEVEATVLRMGFVKRAEFEALSARVAKLDGNNDAAKSKPAKSKPAKSKPAKSTTAGAKKSSAKPSAKKATAKKPATKKSVAKKSVANKSAAKKASK